MTDNFLIDGSGWITIKSGLSKGVVPASYCDLQPPTTNTKMFLASDRPSSTYSTSSISLSGSTTSGTPTSTTTFKKKGPAVAPRRAAKKPQPPPPAAIVHHVEALYDYTAHSETEFSMREGERFVLVVRDDGNGWAEVQRDGVRGCVPGNYVRDV